jgi:formylglycine-generating enzyme required for sulfatase activity
MGESPWGDEWHAATANTRESGNGTTTPVGCYRDGASPYGTLDMSGNVVEWTATPWTDNYAQSYGTTREAEDGQAFVWRGGGWSNIHRLARCAYRFNYSPASRNFTLGVRIVTTPDD